MTIAPGNYEAKAVKDGIQIGETENGTLQIALEMEVFDAQGKTIENMTTFMYFSEGAAVYSYERLRALGWEGKGPEDIDNLSGIYKNKVPVRVTAPEQYKDKTGAMKMGQSKLEILSGTGTVKLSKPLDMSTFKARLRAIGGGAPATGTSGGGSAPPF